jgi:hypothetical protein
VKPGPSLEAITDRRRLLGAGGLLATSAVLLAACGSGSSSASSTTPTTVYRATANDVEILRTGSSVEAFAISAYDKALASGLLVDPNVQSAAKLFHDHHSRHADLFARALFNGKSTPDATPNSYLVSLFTPRLLTLATERDVILLLNDVERVASDTYQSDVGRFDNKTYNITVMQVGGTEAAHIANWGLTLGTSPTPDGAFQTTGSAVQPATGI